MAATHDLRLISFDLCPYVERSRIVLEEKRLPYQIKFIDLAAKPDWFLAISPRGKVPVLLVDERPVFESMVINELLEELYPEPAMFPRDPLARAQARAWVVFANDVVMPAWAEFAFLGKTEEARRAARGKLADAFGKLEAQLATRPGGPFFGGPDFGLVDAVYAPFFDRWLPGSEPDDMLADRPALAAYARALCERPSVLAAQASDLAEKMRARARETRAAT